MRAGLLDPHLIHTSEVFFGIGAEYGLGISGICVKEPLTKSLGEIVERLTEYCAGPVNAGWTSALHAASANATRYGKESGRDERSLSEWK